MNSIEINISNIGNNITLYIDAKNNKINVNNQEKNITNDDIDTLIRIIRTWKKIYPKSNIIDGEKVLIKIKDNEELDIITIEGTYPKNYQEFKNWLWRFL